MGVVDQEVHREDIQTHQVVRKRDAPLQNRDDCAQLDAVTAQRKDHRLDEISENSPMCIAIELDKETVRAPGGMRLVQFEDIDRAKSLPILRTKLLGRREAKANSARYSEETHCLTECIAIGLGLNHPIDETSVPRSEERTEITDFTAAHLFLFHLHCMLRRVRLHSTKRYVLITRTF